MFTIFNNCPTFTRKLICQATQLQGLDDLNPPKRLPYVLFGTLITSCILASGTIFSAAWAGYEPPEGDPPSGSSVSNGSRSGCAAVDMADRVPGNATDRVTGDTNSIPLTVLAPSQHVGQTTVSRPTVVWYITADAPYLGYLVLSEVTPNGLVTVYEMAEAVEWQQGGLGSFTLPDNGPALEPGKRYHWSVAIACSTETPTYGQAFEVEFDVVESLADLEATWPPGTTAQDATEIYAANGYWYDAIWAAVNANETADNPGTVGNGVAIATLLNELATLENNEHGEALRKIAQQF